MEMLSNSTVIHAKSKGLFCSLLGLRTFEVPEFAIVCTLPDPFGNDTKILKNIKTGSHDAICDRRFFYADFKGIIPVLVNLKAVVYCKSHRMNQPYAPGLHKNLFLHLMRSTARTHSHVMFNCQPSESYIKSLSKKFNSTDLKAMWGDFQPSLP